MAFGVGTGLPSLLCSSLLDTMGPYYSGMVSIIYKMFSEVKGTVVNI